MKEVAVKDPATKEGPVKDPVKSSAKGPVNDPVQDSAKVIDADADNRLIENNFGPDFDELFGAAEQQAVGEENSEEFDKIMEKVNERRGLQRRAGQARRRTRARTPS